MREKLIDSILDLSGDEFENKEDYIKLAKQSDAELMDRIIHIAKYYRDLCNEEF